MSESLKNYFFTSESVSEGHPDKVADQISDAILDAYLEQDPKSRVACETMVTTGMVVIAGEVTSTAHVPHSQIIRKTIKNIGYDERVEGFNYNSCAILKSLDQQSPDIAMGVDSADESNFGAGDQGLMFGYAINETPELMPLSIQMSHQIVKELAHLRKNDVDFNQILPDSKSQVTVEYEGGKVKRIGTVVLSTQHTNDMSLDDLKVLVQNGLFNKVIPTDLVDEKTKYFINPTGRFVIGGPYGDCGLTGRKIIVDTYGGHGAHGGGAFSGKDSTKVDRSAAYASRHIAKNIVASGAAERCLVQLSYAIGVAEPTSVMVETYGTENTDVDKLSSMVKELWDLRPGAIIKSLGLTQPRFSPTAAYGHFGRNEDGFTWEKCDRVNDIKTFLKL